MRLSTHLLSLGLLAPLAAALPAQEGAETAPTETVRTEAPRTAVTLRTTDQGLYFLLASRVPSGADAIEVAPGEAAEFRLDTAGEISVRKITASSYLFVDIDPGLLMDAFPTEVEELGKQIDGFAAVIALQSNQKPKDVAASMRELLQLPRQIARLQLSIAEDPTPILMDPAAEGDVRIQIEAQPVADTDFAALHAALEPSDADVPMLSGRNALMSMSMNVDMARLEPFTTNLMSKLLGMMAGTMDEAMAEEMTGYMKVWTSAMGGLGSFVWDAEQGMSGIFSLREPEAMRTSLTSEAYADFMRRGSEATGSEVSIAEDFEVRGVSVLRMETAVPMAAMPAEMPIPVLNEDGKMVQRLAVAGDFLLMSMFEQGDDGNAMRSLIGAVLDGEVRSRRSQDLMRMELSIPKFVELAGAPVPTNALPESFSTVLRKTDRALRLEIRMR